MEKYVVKKIFTAAWAVLLFACCQLAAAALNVSVTATPSNPTAPASVTLAASGDSDGNPILVTKVEYFNGTTSLGVSVQSPFALTLNNLAAGTYQVSAKVTTTDPANPVLQSATLAVTVGTAPGAATAYFIHTDQLNTPRAITDGGGNLVWQWDSDPFGKDAANEQPAGHPSFTFNQRFPGQQFDRENSLHYNYYRDYDPQLGRYIESDPIGLHGGPNTYGYAGANPLINVDPDGRFFFLAFAGPSIAAAVGDAAVIGGAWWSLQQPAVSPAQGTPDGIIPPQDFPNGISWPPKGDPKNCRIDLPPPKSPPPKKPDCEAIFQVCRSAVKSNASNPALRIAGDFSCLAAYAICKKVKDH